MRAAVIGDEKPEGLILTYRHRSGSGREWEDVRETVPLSWTVCNFGGEAVVRLSRSGMQQEGCDPLRTRALLPVPPLLRPQLREPARG